MWVPWGCEGGRGPHGGLGVCAAPRRVLRREGVA